MATIKRPNLNRWASYLALLILMLAGGRTATGAVLVVAPSDAPEAVREAADFTCDGEGDQEEIRAAILALPETGGTVKLLAGKYDIRKVEGELGGVIIDRSHVTLAGEGAATKLILAPEQNTNVIRIIGENVGHVTVRDLYVDQNRDQNPDGGEQFSHISHGRFEYCGIKAFRGRPGDSITNPVHNITIENCHVVNVRRLGIMLDGKYMRVINNHLGNAGSDVVEILGGPGIIQGNFATITGDTHVAFGSDRGNSIIMADNVLHVTEQGNIDIGFRTWAKSERHVISDNVIIVDKGGRLGLAMDVRGYGSTITGNVVENKNEKPIPLWLTGCDLLFSQNYLKNIVLTINDKTGKNLPIRVHQNLMQESTIDHQAGNLITD